MPDVQDSSYLSELGAHCDLSFTKFLEGMSQSTQFRAFPKSKFDAVYFSRLSEDARAYLELFFVQYVGFGCFVLDVVRNESFSLKLQPLLFSRKS